VENPAEPAITGWLSRRRAGQVGRQRAERCPQGQGQGVAVGLTDLVGRVDLEQQSTPIRPPLARGYHDAGRAALLIGY
jgi:hypothetical protein